MPRYEDPDERYDEVVERASNGVHTGARSGRRSLDDMAEIVTDWREQATPAARRMAERAADAAREGAEWMRRRTDRMRQGVSQASGRAVGYARDEPARTLLMAVAAGAVIYALMRLVRGSEND